MVSLNKVKLGLNMKFFIQTFGCQMNEADSQEMAGHLQARGLSATASPEDADVLVLNTCTVRQHAEQRALSYIGRLRAWKEKKNPRKIIVAGCAAERLKKNLRHRFNHIDLVAGAKSIEEFPRLLDSILGKDYNWFEESEISFGAGDLRNVGKPLLLGQEETTAFVTIMRGCNYSCSYCIVPSVRGREIYRDKSIILKEIEDKAAAGAKELMLLGQTVNSYWHKLGTAPYSPEKLGAVPNFYDFSDLLTDVEKIKGISSIKFMSPHPHYMSDKLIATIAASKKISSQIHLPVQSGSNPVLKRMKRNYTREEYIELHKKLSAAKKDLQLSTDFIVGFPNETDEDFNLTLDLAERVPFSLAYCFKYSPRPGTESHAFNDTVPQAVKEDRLAQLLKKLETKKECSASS